MDCRKYFQAISYIFDWAYSMPRLLRRLEQSTSGKLEYILRADPQLFRLRRDCSRCAQQLPRLLYFWPCCFRSYDQNLLVQYSMAQLYLLRRQQQLAMWNMRSWYSFSDLHYQLKLCLSVCYYCFNIYKASSNYPIWQRWSPRLNALSLQSSPPSTSSLFMPYLQLCSERHLLFMVQEYLVSALFLDGLVLIVFCAFFSLRLSTIVNLQKSAQSNNFSIASKI